MDFQPTRNDADANMLVRQLSLGNPASLRPNLPSLLVSGWDVVLNLMFALLLIPLVCSKLVLFEDLFLTSGWINKFCCQCKPLLGIQKERRGRLISLFFLGTFNHQHLLSRRGRLHQEPTLAEPTQETPAQEQPTLGIEDTSTARSPAVRRTLA